MVCLFHKSMDRFNREFWTEQMRRLCDLIAEETLFRARRERVLEQRRGVFFMVHHDYE